MLFWAVTAIAIVAEQPLRGQTVAEVADEATAIAEVLAADDRRIAAMTTADKQALETVCDDDLHYAHSSGTVDTKPSLIDSITRGRTKYLAFDPVERTVSFPAPGIAVVTGQAAVRVANEQGRHDVRLRFLAVWREVRGEWKFFAWQSARLPPAG